MLLAAHSVSGRIGSSTATDGDGAAHEAGERLLAPETVFPVVDRVTL